MKTIVIEADGDIHFPQGPLNKVEQILLGKILFDLEKDYYGKIIFYTGITSEDLDNIE